MPRETYLGPAPNRESDKYGGIQMDSLIMSAALDELAIADQLLNRSSGAPNATI